MLGVGGEQLGGQRPALGRADVTDRGHVGADRSLLERYAQAAASLADAGVLRTAVSVMASHGQHLTVLRRALGRQPLAGPLEPPG